MSVAYISSLRSKDPRTQVGACIVDKNHRIISTGYNGMVNGCNDIDMPWGRSKGLDGKYLYVVHSELNAILHARINLEGCKIYVTLFPCNECVKAIIQSGIKEIIYLNDNILFAGLEIPVIIKKFDYYSRIALNDKIKYCRIKREVIKGKYHYYAQFIIEGVPPMSINKTTGEIKHYINNGVVGLDIGTQTLGICSKTEVKLLELAPEVQNIEKRKRVLQRKMDRSRRATNPNKFNDSGTYKSKNNIKWIKSKHYIETQMQLKE